MSSVLLLLLMVSILLIASFVFIYIGLSKGSSIAKRLAGSLYQIKHMDLDNYKIETSNFSFTLTNLRNQLIINNIPLKPIDFIVFSIVASITVSVLSYLALKMVSLSILLVLFLSLLPMFLLNIMTIRKADKIDSDVNDFIKLMKSRAIGDANANLLFSESVQALSNKSRIKVLLNDVEDKVFRLNISLSDALLDVGRVLRNSNMIALSNIIYRNKEDGTSIKSLLTNLIKVIDSNVQEKNQQHLMLQPHIKSFLFFIGFYLLFVFGMKFMLSPIYKVLIERGYSFAFSVSLIFLLLEGLILFIFSNNR